eukprot:8352445-Pyramimonas_sp.AAC.1
MERPAPPGRAQPGNWLDKLRLHKHHILRSNCIRRQRRSRSISLCRQENRIWAIMIWGHFSRST